MVGLRELKNCNVSEEPYREVPSSKSTRWQWQQSNKGFAKSVSSRNRNRVKKHSVRVYVLVQRSCPSHIIPLPNDTLWKSGDGFDYVNLNLRWVPILGSMPPYGLWTAPFWDKPFLGTSHPHSPMFPLPAGRKQQNFDCD